MKIAPSILDANWSALGADLDSIATADRIHLDIMDGHYVPNLSFGFAALRHIKWPIETEAHLMVQNPENFIESFMELDCRGITFHIEATGQDRARNLLDDLRACQIRAGICVDGYTSVDMLSDEILASADQILLMSVKAGFGGQSFMPEVFDKIKTLRQRGYKGEIEIDGGCKLENATELKAAGADICVVGSALMKQSDRAQYIKEFQNI